MRNLRFFLVSLSLILLSLPVLAQSTPGVTNFPRTVDDDDSLLRTSIPRVTALVGALRPNDTTITVQSTVGFPATGVLRIDDEIIYYRGRVQNGFTGILRGQEGTQAAPHNSNAKVENTLNNASHEVLKRALIATQQAVGGVAYLAQGYGAKCDGTTDDTTALQAAIDAVAAGKGTLQLPRGTCLVSQLVLKANVKVKGAGKGATVIKSVSNLPIITITTEAERAGLYDLTVQGDQSQSAQIGVDLAGNGYTYGSLFIDNVEIKQCGAQGLRGYDMFSFEANRLDIDDCVGYPLDIDATNRPAVILRNVYVHQVRTTAPAAYRIRAGTVRCENCNGLDGVKPGISWAILGKKTGVDGDAIDAAAYFVCNNCNLESWTQYGIQHYSSSVSQLEGNCTFFGDSSTYGSQIALNYEVVSANFPAYFSKGRFDEKTYFGPASNYANSQPIHSNDIPPVTLDRAIGQQPAFAGTSEYYDSTTSRSEQLMRADSLLPPVTVTADTTFTRRGIRYIVANCSSSCVVTIPWAGWYREGEEIIIRAPQATPTASVYIAAGSGSQVNGSSSFQMNVTGQTVRLVADAGASQWRIVGNSSPNLISGTGSATRLAVYDGPNSVTSVANLTYDPGNGALQSPTRFWGIDASSGAPTYGFTNDYSSGMFRPGSGQLGFAVSGSEKLRLTSTNLDLRSSKILWDGTSGNLIDTYGSGTPEGSVTADVGSTYRRTNGSTGTSFYIKESGTGNTGWSTFLTGSGTSPRVAYWSSATGLTSVSGFEYDSGSSVVKSPARFWGADTASGAPTFAFTSDLSTGIFKPGSNQLGFSVGGSEKLRLTSTALDLRGSIQIFDGTSGNVIDRTGSGSPEGSVTADVGSTYRRTNGSTGSTLYVKESGSGNTGWIAHGAGGSSFSTAISLASLTLPSAASQDLWYETTRKDAVLNAAGLNRALSGSFYWQGSQKTVTGTSETTMLSGTADSVDTLPANYLVNGRTIEIEAGGVYSTGGSGATPTVRLKLGATTIATANAAGIAASLTNGLWRLRAQVVTFLTGASGTVQVVGWVDYYDSTAGYFLTAPLVTTSAVTIDTTTTLQINLTHQWDTSGNTLKVNTLNFRSVN